MVEFLSIQAVEANDASEPIAYAYAKQWARVDHADDDSLFMTLVSTSRYDIEQSTNRKLVAHEVTVVVNLTCPERFSLPYGKAENIVITDDDTDEEVDSDVYKISGSSIRFFNPGTYKITYTVGETNEALNELVMQLSAYRYNNPGDVDNKMPDDIVKRLDKYRLEWL